MLRFRWRLLTLGNGWTFQISSMFNLVKQTRGGAMYNSGWGQRAVDLDHTLICFHRFKLALRKYGLISACLT